MEFPILSKELRVTLRRRESFFTAFFLYSFLAAAVSLVWAIMVEQQMFVYWRDWAARVLFFFTIGFGFFGFCFQAGLMASKILVLEREKNSSSLLRITPVRSWSIVFQKMATPILIEWLFFIGMLPILSLVFLLGGVSPNEFVYQLTNLVVWTNTSILIGLRFSAYSKNTNKARGRTIGSIILLVFFVPHAAQFFQSLSTVFGLTLQQVNLEIFLKDLFLGLAKAASPLEAISPVWMCMSWYLGDTLMVWPFFDDFFFELKISQVFPACPAAFSWILHIVFQIVLFFGAVKGWKETTEEADSAVEFKREGGILSFIKWIKSGRARRGWFHGSWRVFYDLEDRELFKKGRVSKTIILSIFVLMVLIYLVFLVVADERTIAEYGLVIFPVTTTISLLAGIGFAANSLRRERDRNCATFLLASPVEARSIFFGKWMYFMGVVFKGMLVGLAATLIWCNFAWPGRRPDQNITFVILFFTSSWVPLLTGLSLYFGSRSKKGWSVWRFLIPIGLFWGLGFMIIFVVEFLDSVRFLEGLAEFLEWLVYIFIPWGLVILSILASLVCRSLHPSGPSGVSGFRFTFCTLFTLILLLEIWGALSNQSMQFVYWGNETIRVEDARIVGRWTAIPATLAFLFWIYIATRKKKWWLRVLIGKEQSL